MGTGSVPQVSAWQPGDGSGNGDADDNYGGLAEGEGVQGGAAEGDVDAAPPPTTGRKKKGKQKQTLFTLGALPN